MGSAALVTFMVMVMFGDGIAAGRNFILSVLALRSPNMKSFRIRLRLLVALADELLYPLSISRPRMLLLPLHRCHCCCCIIVIAVVLILFLSLGHQQLLPLSLGTAMNDDGIILRLVCISVACWML